MSILGISFLLKSPVKISTSAPRSVRSFANVLTASVSVISQAANLILSPLILAMSTNRRHVAPPIPWLAQ